MESLPSKLPERPVGWTKQMTLHLNFGRGKGFGSFKIRDDEGREMPIGYQYDNRADGQTGFFLIGREKNSPVISWLELCRVWPRFLREASGRG